jgi:hypothetical protein
MFLRGGVYLRSDLGIGVTACTVGQDGADRGGGQDIPTQFFNGRSTPILATLERQATAGASTLTTENVSINTVPAFAGTNYGWQLTLATGPTTAYTTALNSRIRLRTHPVTGGAPPPVVKQGYVDILTAQERPQWTSRNLPYLAVAFSDVGYDSNFGGNALRAESYAFTCTWIRELNTGESIDAELIEDAMIWIQMIDDDNYLGGGAEWSEPMGPTFEPDEDIRMAFRERNLDIIHFGVRANRGEIRNKFS